LQRCLLRPPPPPPPPAALSSAPPQPASHAPHPVSALLFNSRCRRPCPLASSCTPAPPAASVPRRTSSAAFAQARPAVSQALQRSAVSVAIHIRFTKEVN
ncbi:hypothetical protein BRADI_2g17899v3, partial [Brachypodium distachyon]